MTAVDLSPRETEQPALPSRKRPKGQPVRGTKQIRLRLPGYPRFRLASGVYTDAEYRRVVEAVKAAAAVGRRDWLDALLKHQRAPVDLANELREVKGRADQLPEPNVTPFTEAVVRAWLDAAKAQERFGKEHQDMLEKRLLPLTGALNPTKRGRAAFNATKRAPNWTNRLDDLPQVLRKERARYAELRAYASFANTRNCALTYLRDVLGTIHMTYLRAKDVKLFSADEKAKAPRKLKLLNLPIADALRIADRLEPRFRDAWVTTLLTGANPKELWVDGMTRDFETGHIHIHGVKRKGRNRKVPFLTLHWRGKVYAPNLVKPPVSQNIMCDKLKSEYGGVAKLYDARRSYSTYLGEALIDPVAAVAYMGHKPQNQTQQYMMANGRYAQNKTVLDGHAKTVVAHLQEQLRLADEAELTDKLPNTRVQAG